jgi:hypothetical protein
MRGFQFFLDQLQIPRNLVRIDVDFSGSGIYNAIPEGEGNYSGAPIGAANVVYGNFDGNSYINLSDSGTFYNSSWSMFFVFERSGIGNHILFSNYEGNTNKSGFVIGVNSANNLYAETYTELGPTVYETNINLSSKNAVVVNKNVYSLSFEYFNFNTKLTNTENFFFNTTGGFVNCENFHLGAAPNAPSYFSGQTFSGNMDAFIYITGNLLPYQIDTLFQGFTLLRAPQNYYTVLGENCFYDHENLTGNFSNIIFNNVDTLSYLVQTGYLAGKTGQLEANMTGTILSGTGISSGYITGFINSGSGFINTGYNSFSGFFDVTLFQGLRVFESTIPSGVSGTYIVFPDNFINEPVILTELDLPSGFVIHQTSGISTSGFFVNFSENINQSGCVLTTIAAPIQNYSGFRVDNVDIPQGVINKDITFNSGFYNLPKIYCSLDNDIEFVSLEHYVSNISATGFTVNFSEVTSPNYKLNYIASDLVLSDGVEIRQDIITSGVSGQFIPFTSGYGVSPLTIAELVNISGELLLDHKLAETTSGFNVYFSDTISSNNYRLDSITFSGEESMAQYITGTFEGLTYLGQLTDEACNVYNLSGFGVSTKIIPYDITGSKSVYMSGIDTTITSGVDIIQVGVNIPVSCNVELLTGQSANFIHTVHYTNPGNNFLTVNHTVYYDSEAIQPTPFYIFKNCNQFLGLKLEDYTYDSGYIYSFGMDGVAYIGLENSTDYSSLFITPNTHNKTNINKVGFVDRTRGYYFLDNFYNLNLVNLYENGAALLGSGYTYSGSQIIISGDYGLNGTYAILQDNPQGDAEAIYDIISGSRHYFRIPEDYLSISGDFYLPSLEPFNQNIYLNGVKLETGINYFGERVGNADLIKIDNSLSSATGKVFTFPVETGLQYTGYFNSRLTNKFPRGTSMLWSNGIRQRLDDEYLEIAKMSLLTGSRTFNENNNLIFNNNIDFWE